MGPGLAPPCESLASGIRGRGCSLPTPPPASGGRLSPGVGAGHAIWTHPRLAWGSHADWDPGRALCPRSAREEEVSGHRPSRTALTMPGGVELARVGPGADSGGLGLESQAGGLGGLLSAPGR